MLNKISFLKDKFDGHMQEIISAASLAFILKIFGTGIAFAFNVLLARFLGADGAGLYFLALTVTTIATVFGRMGIDNVFVRFIAAGASVGDWAEVKGVYQKGIIFATFSSVIVTLIMFFISPWLAVTVFNKPELTTHLRWISIAVLPLSLVILHSEALKGLKKIRDFILIQFIGLPLLSLIIFFIIGRVLGVKGAILSITSASIIMLFVCFFVWKVSTPFLKNVSGHFDTGKLLKSSIPLFGGTMLGLLINWTSIFLLGIWGTNADVGIFSLAARTAMLISLTLIAVNSIAAPKFAELYKLGDIKALGSTARSSAKMTTLLASPVLIFFIFLSDWIMGIFGSEFTGGGFILIILALGQFINVATGSVGYLLIMSGNETLMRNITALTALTNLLLNLWLIPIYGILGAAIATAVSLSLQNLLAAFYVFKKIKISTFF